MLASGRREHIHQAEQRAPFFGIGHPRAQRDDVDEWDPATITAADVTTSTSTKAPAASAVERRTPCASFTLI